MDVEINYRVIIEHCEIIRLDIYLRIDSRPSFLKLESDNSLTFVIIMFSKLSLRGQGDIFTNMTSWSSPYGTGRDKL